MPMKNQFLNRPSKILNLLSSRRLLQKVSRGSLAASEQTLVTYFHWLKICIQTKVLKTRVAIWSLGGISDRGRIPLGLP